MNACTYILCMYTSQFKGVSWRASPRSGKIGSAKAKIRANSGKFCNDSWRRLQLPKAAHVRYEDMPQENFGIASLSILLASFLKRTIIFCCT